MTYLEGDGPKPEIYHLLWKNDSLYQEINHFNIPDTIIFAKGVPTVWYFNSLEGKILRKKAENITMENIIKRFTSKHSQDTIVAYFISMNIQDIQERFLTRHKTKVKGL